MSRGKSSLCYSGQSTGMAQAILAEIAQHLDRLAAVGESSVIDLRSLPLTEADLAELKDLLGSGEVHAELDVIGRTDVLETAFAGVWWIRHYGRGGQIASEEITITLVPEILRAQPEDVVLAAVQIRNRLENPAPDGAVTEANHG